ncbi:MAG: uncharacterized protein QOC59_708 [Microbacteriaceae bacterium]|nr:uncharacterized protein [Microbacteriaceae bacterium]
MVTIAVEGVARRFLPAERGTVRVVVRLESPDRAAASSAAAELHRRIAGEARAHVASGSATWWGADQVRLSTARRYLKDSDVTELYYVAAADVSVKFADFDALSAWIASIGSLEGVDLDSIHWTLTDVHRVEVQREVRAEAVLDARERARAYAGVLGLDTIELQAVYEPGLRPNASSAHGGSSDFVLTRAMSAAGGGEEFSLKPDDIEVGAAITADFVAS